MGAAQSERSRRTLKAQSIYRHRFTSLATRESLIARLHAGRPAGGGIMMGTRRAEETGSRT